MIDSPSGRQIRRVLFVPMSSAGRTHFQNIQRSFATPQIADPQHSPDPLLSEDGSSPVPSVSCDFSSTHDYEIHWADDADDAVEIVRQSIWDEQPFALVLLDAGEPPHWAGLQLPWRFWLVDPELLLAVYVHSSDDAWPDAIENLPRPECIVPLRPSLQESEIRHLAALGHHQHELAHLARLKRSEIVALADNRIRRTRESDLAERNRIEEELCRERDFRDRVMQTSSAYIVAATPDGNVTMTSASLLQILGYAAHEVIGKNWINLCLPEYERQRVSQMLGQLSGSQQELVMEIEMLARSGEMLVVEWHAKIAPKGAGDLDLVIAVGINVTQRKRAEEELNRRAQDLEAANHRLEELTSTAQAATWAKSEFLANMSHEIRTPMTAILGFAENLLSPDLSELDRAACIETIRRNGEHLLEIVNDILDLSKIEAGRVEIETVPCCPGQLAVDVHELMLERARGKGLDFELQFANPLPAVIRSDPVRLRQILINLVGNAIKFTARGRIRLEVGCSREPGAPPEIHFLVSDSGIGMNQDQIQRLYVPFSQADNSSTRPFGGTGLGLAICKRLIDRLGGSIDVESTPGKGTTFQVTIPAGFLGASRMISSPEQLVAPSQPPKPAPAPPAHSLSCRVLLAEDTPDNQRLIRIILSNAGAQVEIAEDGQLALDTALAAVEQGNPFDVILMDIQMPVLDGYEATARLRQRGYHRPIVALTAHAMAGDRERCLQAGCDDFISKPVKREDLVAIVARYAQPQHAISSGS